MNPSHSKPTSWTSLLAWLTVAATVGLIFVGAMVTTKDYGLSVPDWPLSFGSLNPPRWWTIEGVNWEHGHRLFGAAIGLLTIALAIALWRSHRRSGVRWLGIAAVACVGVQGIFGGLRVTEISTTLAIVHGCFAQAFFALLVFIAAVASPGWIGRFTLADASAVRRLRWLAGLFAAAVYVQLIVGAIMRHFKAGLAIPDFPLAMGRLVPPIGSFAVGIHFAHRAWALVVVVLGVVLLIVALRRFRGNGMVAGPAVLLVFLLALQVSLGALVIWGLRAPVPTCLHVVNGAAVLGLGIFLLAGAFALVPRGALIAARPGAMAAVGRLPEAAA